MPFCPLRIQQMDNTQAHSYMQTMHSYLLFWSYLFTELTSRGFRKDSLSV